MPSRLFAPLDEEGDGKGRKACCGSELPFPEPETSEPFQTQATSAGAAHGRTSATESDEISTITALMSNMTPN